MPQQQHNSAAGRPILQLRNVSKHFGAVSALTDIELEVHAGEVVALVGDNGAGKSTLVKILAGVHQPTSGTIEFDGNPVTLDSPGKALEYGIATVFQELAARIPSVREPVASLSGGQRQTVAIARSLLLNPKIIMLDEPTAALGVAQTAEVLNLIERVRERGLGVIIISHNMEDVRAVADRIVVLRLGRNKGIFTPDASNQDLVAVITGATENAVSRRVERKSQPTTSGAM